MSVTTKKVTLRLSIWSFFQISASGIIAVFLLAGEPNAQNLVAPSPVPKPSFRQTFDIRTFRTNTAPPSGQQRRDLLQHFPDVPDIQAAWSSLTEAPSRLSSLKQSLSRPSPKPATDIAREFLRDHLDLFRLVTEDIDDLYVTREHTTNRLGITHLTLQQQADGIFFFNSAFVFTVSATGEILSVSGEVMSRLSATITKPKLRTDDAVRVAAANVEVPISASLRTLEASGDPDQRTIFDKGIHFGQDVPVRLVYFPVELQRSRLAWEVLINRKGSADVFRILVDAEDGTVLFRDNRTHY